MGTPMFLLKTKRASTEATTSRARPTSAALSSAHIKKADFSSDQVTKLLVAHKNGLATFKKDAIEGQNLLHLGLYPFLEALELYHTAPTLDDKTLRINQTQTFLRLGQLSQNKQTLLKLFSSLDAEEIHLLATRRQQTMDEKRSFMQVSKKVKTFYETHKPLNSVFIQDQRDRQNMIATRAAHDGHVDKRLCATLLAINPSDLQERAAKLYQTGEKLIQKQAQLVLQAQISTHKPHYAHAL